MIERLAGLVPATVFVLAALSGGPARAQSPDVTMVLLYRGDVEQAYADGIEAALAAHPLGARVEVRHQPYGDEDTAFRELEAALDDASVDLVLGPTDSGVFLRAVQELGEQTRVPVIAPLVAATVEFDPGGAFFATNASLERRAHRLADTLSKYWLRSLAVLHPESQFGQRTEAAFREAYQLLQPKTVYRSLQYESAEFDARSQVDHVLRDRPEALGIFGTRKEIGAICDLLVEMNTTLTPYRPILFTPIDDRETQPRVGELFVTTVVSDPTDPAMDDVRALAFDNVMMLLDQLEADVPFADQREAFRLRVVDVLRGTRLLEGTEYRTPMMFSGGRNQSPLHIIRAGGERPRIVTAPGLTERFVLKVTLLWRTVGVWPIVNLIIILLIPTFFSVVDLKRWYEGRLLSLVLSPYALLFVSFNVSVVVVLYMYLAETGRIPYQSTLTAVIIAMAPTTLVRSTFFNTPAGKSVGLGDVYEKFLRWLNAQLMMKKYQRRQRFVNIIAYYNTLESMKQELYQMYDNSREVDTRLALRAKLDADLGEAPTNLDQRIVCARRLLTRLNWRILESMGFVPADPSLQGRDPGDPDLVVKVATRYIRDRAERREVLAEQVKRVLAERPDASLPASNGGGKTFPQVRLLVQYGFFTPKRLIEAGLLPENWRTYFQEGGAPEAKAAAGFAGLKEDSATARG